MKATLCVLGSIVLACQITSCLADPSLNSNIKPRVKHTNGPVEEREKREEKIPPNYFAITFYKPTYLLPFYYTGSPYNSVYQNNTPNNEQLNHGEAKFQISFKVPVVKNILHYPSSSLFLAY